MHPGTASGRHAMRSDAENSGREMSCSVPTQTPAATSLDNTTPSRLSSKVVGLGCRVQGVPLFEAQQDEA